MEGSILSLQRGLWGKLFQRVIARWGVMESGSCGEGVLDTEYNRSRRMRRCLIIILKIKNMSNTYFLTKRLAFRMAYRLLFVALGLSSGANFVIKSYLEDEDQDILEFISQS